MRGSPVTWASARTPCASGGAGSPAAAWTGWLTCPGRADRGGQAAVKRLHAAWPNAIMIHTPVHASWLNQAEIFFSITQKKVISPNDFASLDELAGTLLAFVDRYNQTARPFNWKFTAADLARLLDRISAREHTAQNPAKLPEAA